VYNNNVNDSIINKPVDSPELVIKTAESGMLTYIGEGSEEFEDQSEPQSSNDVENEKSD